MAFSCSATASATPSEFTRYVLPSPSKPSGGMTGTTPCASSDWSSSASTRSTLPVKRWSTPWRMPTGCATITFALAARRSLAERPSRISWVSRLAAVRARSSVAASVTPVPSKSEAVTWRLFSERLDLRRRAVDEHDPDVQRPEQRHVQHQRREVVVRDDGAVNRQDERLLAELWNVLQDAPQIGQFHVSATRG